VSSHHEHGHGHGHGHEEHGAEHHYTQEYWDERYGSSERVWSGNPNPQLVAQVVGLDPRDALDAGSGEGADAIWLASQGWQVTAVDVSPVALQRAAAHAAERGAEIADRISWQHEDLLTWDPGRERFDLVSAQFMHLPDPELQGLHQRLAAAVRPGGTLLLVLHHADDQHVNIGRPSGHPRLFPPPEQIVATLDPAEFDIVLAGAVERPAIGLDGEAVTVKDTVIRAVRRS
jgi:SAM-dependent methyltransferase